MGEKLNEQELAALAAMEAADKPAGRSAAKWEVREERRHRPGGALDMSTTLKLDLPSDMYADGAPLDANRYVSRWISDQGNNVHNLTREGGWDFVSADGSAGLMQVDDARADSTLMSRPVDTDKWGNPIRGFLCRKPREQFEEEQSGVVRRSERQMQGIVEGDAPIHATAGAAGVEKAYAPAAASGNMFGAQRNQGLKAGGYKP
jgi:hypothetical protein